MNIYHNPVFNKERVEEFYSERDGTEVKYVCTTELDIDNVPMDIFYRSTPHPNFGNRYFGLYYHPVRKQLIICNADKVESLKFAMIPVDNKYYYSQTRHDFKVIEGKMIDGGRAYTRTNCADDIVTLRVVDGVFCSDYEKIKEN